MNKQFTTEETEMANKHRKMFKLTNEIELCIIILNKLKSLAEAVKQCVILYTVVRKVNMLHSFEE